MPGFDTGSVLYALNVDFTGNSLTAGTAQMVSDGQLLIGSSTAPNIRVATLTAGSGVSITNGHGTISIGLSGGSSVQTITAGANINLTGTASNPIINLNAQILEPNGTAAAPSYSFATNPTWGFYFDGAKLGFSAGNNEVFFFDGFNLTTNQTNNTFNGGININSYFAPNYTNPGSYPYTVLSADYYISVNTSSTANTINFPNSPRGNITYIVKDRTGNAATHNITLTTPGATILFDGSTTYVIDTNYGSVQLMWNGTNFEVY